MAETTDVLLEAVKAAFIRHSMRIRMKKPTYEAANEYAGKLGKALSDSFAEVLTEGNLLDGHLYRETAEAVVRPLLEDAYRTVAEAAKSAQNATNEAAGVALKAVEPMTAVQKAAHIQNVINSTVQPDDYAQEMSTLSRESTLFSRKVVDYSAQRNAEFQSRAGLQTLVSREYDGVGVHNGKELCQWCLSRCGSDVPYDEAYAKGMFERHPGCGCVITYRTGGKVYTQGRGQWQDNSWSEAREERIRLSEEGTSQNEGLLSKGRTDLRNEIVGRSVSAKFQNYDILDLETGEHYHLAEGSKLQDKEVFAGKGSKKRYRIAPEFAKKYGGKAEDWQHVKGRAVLDTPDGDREAEIHWSQCEGIGKHEMFVKRWLEE